MYALCTLQEGWDVAAVLFSWGPPSCTPSLVIPMMALVELQNGTNEGKRGSLASFHPLAHTYIQYIFFCHRQGAVIVVGSSLPVRPRQKSHLNSPVSGRHYYIQTGHSPQFLPSFFPFTPLRPLLLESSLSVPLSPNTEINPSTCRVVVI